MTRAAPQVVRSRRMAAVVGLVLLAFSMRTAIAVIGPLFGAISADIPVDVLTLAVVGTAPPVGFALAGLVVPALVRRFGLEPALLLSFVVLIAAQVARALVFEGVGLVVSTFLAVFGLGVATVLVPPFLRAWFPRAVAGVTALYLVLVSVGSALPAFVSVQLADAIGWRGALAVWLAVPLLALVPLWMLRRGSDVVDAEADLLVDDAPRPPRPLVTSPTAWAVMTMLLVPSVSIYAASAVLPTILVDTASLPAADAGAALGLVYLLGTPQAFLVPVVKRRPGLVLPLTVVAGLSGILGWGGLLLAPGAAPFLWAACIGLVPITFPLSMLLINTRSRTQPTAVTVSGFVHGVAYVGTATVTLSLGLLHEATGGWAVPLLVVAASSVLVVPAVVALARGRMVDDEVQRP